MPSTKGCSAVALLHTRWLRRLVPCWRSPPRARRAPVAGPPTPFAACHAAAAAPRLSGAAAAHPAAPAGRRQGALRASSGCRGLAAAGRRR